MDRCECGFDFEAVLVEHVPDRVGRGVAAIEGALTGADADVGTRPSSDRWSTVEYAAHVRDVLLTIRDRLVIGLVEDNPGFKPLYRDERIALGLYRADTAQTVAVELAAASAMFLRLLHQIDAGSLYRDVQYGFPGPTTRTLGWMAKQAAHEVEHHHGDMVANHDLLSAG